MHQRLSSGRIGMRRGKLPGKGEYMAKHKPKTHEEDPLLTPHAVGKLIGKRGETVIRWCQDGLLKAVRMPSGLWGIRESEVNKLLAGSALDAKV